MLTELRGMLAPSERGYREGAFSEAHRFIDRAARKDGVSALSRPVKKSFPTRPRQDRRRVDIEVSKGTAFVPEAPQADVGV